MTDTQQTTKEPSTVVQDLHAADAALAEAQRQIMRVRDRLAIRAGLLMAGVDQ